MPSLFATAALIAGSVVAVGQGNDVVAEGRKLYLTNGCYACHGLEARGHLGPNLVLTTKTDDELFERIINGRPGTAMPVNRTRMSEQDIRAVIAYLRSLRQSPLGMPNRAPGEGLPLPTEPLNQAR
jgi:mono/diheme cytochrome c family protein